MTSIIYRTGRAAMRCWCEVFLCGEDRSYLAAVGELALDEITRVERMLSRFDPASEVHRLNHAPVGLPLRVTSELLAIFVECRDWWRQTAGAFDITVGSKPGIFLNAGLLPLESEAAATPEKAEARRPKQPPGFGEARWNAIQFDETNHTITRSIDGITFDFGGYGKGYAIDRALTITQQYGIESACLHAGTSSVIASGPPADAVGWPIAIRHPEDESRTVAEWSLCHAGMSTSAALCAGLPTPHQISTAGLPNDRKGRSVPTGDLRSDESAGSGDPRTTMPSDIIDPKHGTLIGHSASCTVMATTAAIAEVWSTALLVRNRATCDNAAVQRVLFQPGSSIIE